MSDSTKRFSNLALDYDRWRPRYPRAAIDFIARELELVAGARIADLGAGTGIFSESLLDAGYAVALVEPNADMLQLARDTLGHWDAITFHQKPAEATGLPDRHVQAAVAAQAFHWFDIPAVREELYRIVEPPHGFAALWNVRRTDTTEFLAAYHAFLIEWGTDYEAIHARQEHASESVEELFEGASFSVACLDNVQHFDYEGLQGRLLSCSFVPRSGDERFAPMLEALRGLYDAYCVGDQVAFEYDCQVFAGRLSK